MRQALPLATLLLAAVPAPAQVLYTVRDLGALPNYPGTPGPAVNNSGQVAFYANPSITSPTHAMRTGPGGVGVEDLGTFLGASPSAASEGFGINDLGQVTGLATRADSSFGPFRSSPNGQPLSLTDLGSGLLGLAINGSGQVAVGSINQFYRSSPNGQPVSLTPLGTLPGYTGTQQDRGGINDRGEVAGTATGGPGGVSHAFRSSANGEPVGLTDLGALPGALNGSTAYGINALGQVVGESGGHAFRSSPTGQPVALQDLGLLPGASSTTARGINALGQVVGWTDQGFTNPTLPRGFLYDDAHGMQSLTALLVPGSGWSINYGIGISDTGYIVALGVQTGGPVHTLLLTPVPGPSALALCGLAAAGFAARRWRS